MLVELSFLQLDLLEFFYLVLKIVINRLKTFVKDSQVITFQYFWALYDVSKVPVSIG